MEKLIYSLWQADPAGNDFRDHLLNDTAPRLLKHPVRGLRISVVDEAVAPAQPMRQSHLCEAPAGLVSVWVDSAHHRDAVEGLLADCCDRFAGYSVAESAPLVAPETEGERVAGMNQVVFLQRPERLERGHWLDVWLDSHTDIAIETQSTFAYRQNIVVRPLTEAAPSIDAIVEEGFPEVAMTSPHAFYDAESDEALERRVGVMLESCARFIDFERINVTPMIDYLLKAI